MNLIIIILWYISILLSLVAGYLFCLKHERRRKSHPCDLSQEERLAALKAQREMDNFWSYDGTQQE